MSRAHLRSFHKAMADLHAMCHDESDDGGVRNFHQQAHDIHKTHLAKLDGAAEGGAIDRGGGDVPVGDLDGPSKSAAVYDGDLEKALGIKLS